MSLLFNWNWHISFREGAEMRPKAPQLFVKKANVSLSRGCYDANDKNRDTPHLFKLPSYSWNIQTVWQYLIQLEWLSTPRKGRINYQVKPFTPDWQTCKNSLCPFDKERSVSENTDNLEWTLKEHFCPSWKRATPLETEEKRRWNSILMGVVWQKQASGKIQRKKKSGLHAKKGGWRGRGGGGFVHMHVYTRT